MDVGALVSNMVPVIYWLCRQVAAQLGSLIEEPNMSLLILSNQYYECLVLLEECALHSFILLGCYKQSSRDELYTDIEIHILVSADFRTAFRDIYGHVDWLLSFLL